MSIDKSREDHIPPAINSIFLGIYSVEKGQKQDGTNWYRYRAYWVVDLPSQERPGETYASTVSVEGLLTEAVWEKLKPYWDTLLEERKDKKTRVQIRAVNPFLKPPTAFVVDTAKSRKAVPVLSMVVYRISHAKRPGEDWTIYRDEQQKAVVRREISEEVNRRIDANPKHLDPRVVELEENERKKSKSRNSRGGVDAFGMM